MHHSLAHICAVSTFHKNVKLNLHISQHSQTEIKIQNFIISTPNVYTEPQQETSTQNLYTKLMFEIYV